MSPNTIQMVGAALFAIAIIHTFSTKYFEQLAHRKPAHSGLWHLLGEVEVVFGIWATCADSAENPASSSTATTARVAMASAASTVLLPVSRVASVSSGCSVPGR